MAMVEGDGVRRVDNRSQDVVGAVERDFADELLAQYIVPDAQIHLDAEEN